MSGLQILFIVCTAVSIQVIHKFLTAWTPSTSSIDDKTHNVRPDEMINYKTVLS